MRLRPFRRRPGDLASCAEVAKVLQSYLDHEVDAEAMARVGRHLEECRRCGLEARLYTEIKVALSRGAVVLDPASLERLRAFGEQLVSQ